MKNKIITNSNLVIYQTKSGKIAFRGDPNRNSIWGDLKQIAELFGVQVPAISKHLKNIYKNGELERISTVSILETVQKEGKRKVKRKIGLYNLDVILSVGYRVNSIQATQFRIWATKVLKQHLIDGYTINEKRLKLQEKKYLELKNTVSLIGNVVRIEDLSVEAKGLSQVISEYTRALDILDDFDHEKLSVPKGTKKAKFELTYEEAQKIIEVMKKKFKDSNLVGQEKDKSFQSSIGAIYQTAGKKDVYSTIEEKAARLLYFVTKNHSFIDGNKRIAASLFVCFLERNGIMYRKNGSRIIDNSTLVALTLMIASSNPKEKDIMVKVIMNLIC